MPKNNILKRVRKIATENNIVLIFDECTSGFRETNGGLHKKYAIDPDIAIFGKAPHGPFSAATAHKGLAGCYSNDLV